MTRRLTWITALALVAACGGAGDTAPDPGEGTDPPETTAAGEAETIADFLGGGAGDDPEAAEADFRDQEARIQESIRQCMAEQGFEYQPVMPPEGSFQVFNPADEEERVREQGFGITTWFGNEDQFGGDTEFVDPNQEMLEEMSDSERDAWYAALHGTPEEQEEGMTTETDPETGDTFQVSEGFGAGCQGEAYEAEYGDQGDTQELWEELQPAFEELNQRVEADPRIVEANQEWSSCMADRGYEYENRQDMYETVFEDFQSRLDEITGPGGGFVDPFEGWSQEEIDAFFEERTQEEIDAFFQEAEQKRREDIDMEAVSALQQEEIDLAVADFECGEDINDLYQEVREDYEGDFIEENRETLEQIREAQGG